MDDAPDIARVGNLLADPSRARMVWLLIDGTRRPAGELAYAAHLSAQSASGHLAKLVRGGLLRTEAHGRHRYFSIASAEVASMVEDIASLAALTRPRLPGPPRVVPTMPAQFLRARTCYGHLAGELAVLTLASMLEKRWLQNAGRDYSVTDRGASELAKLGVNLARVSKARRVFARACIDLTQRRPHLGGALGEALLDAYVERAWIKRLPRSRTVTITPQGHASFRRIFGARVGLSTSARHHGFHPK
jgi:DNA-binding transcriptional ArsR family regulator